MFCFSSSFSLFKKNHMIFMRQLLLTKSFEALKTVGHLPLSHEQTLTDDFLHWFIGFTEGDGCFLVTKRQAVEFIITQHTESKQTLNYIRDQLQFGHVIQQGPRTHRFIVRRLDELRLLILLFNGHLTLATRRAQFKSFLKVYNAKRSVQAIAYKPEKAKVSLDNTWLLGFTEAEGCFTCSLLSNSNAFRTRFIICQKHDENLVVLSQILLLFGTGRLEAHHVKNNYCFIISGLKNIDAIYAYFDKYLDQFAVKRKKQSYLKFKCLNRLLQMKAHLNPTMRPFLIQISHRINRVKRKQK